MGEVDWEFKALTEHVSFGYFLMKSIWPKDAADGIQIKIEIWQKDKFKSDDAFIRPGLPHICVTNVLETSLSTQGHLIKIKVFPTGKHSKKIWL